VTTVYVGLGSNLGTRRRNLSAARRRLREGGVRILRQSRVIETEPWGVSNQPRFLNQVVEAEWSGRPHQLLRLAKEVEREGGRKPSRRWGPRAIDVDILLHPRIAERPFVVESLNELGVSRVGRW
jgi:2-amino-4-hydroxy-6-hydroxymethyldihydropteridine diphosphokinase